MNIKHDCVFALFVVLTVVFVYAIVIQCYIYLLSILLVFLGYKYSKTALKETVDCYGKGVLITGMTQLSIQFMQFTYQKYVIEVLLNILN